MEIDRKEPERKPPSMSKLGAEIAIGTGVGVALGVALDNLGVGIEIGVGVGIALGVAISRRADADGDE